MISPRTSQLSPCTLVEDKVALDRFSPLRTSISIVTNITTTLMHSFICHWHHVILAVDSVVNQHAWKVHRLIRMYSCMCSYLVFYHDSRRSVILSTVNWMETVRLHMQRTIKKKKRTFWIQTLPLCVLLSVKINEVVVQQLSVIWTAVKEPVTLGNLQ